MSGLVPAVVLSVLPLVVTVPLAAVAYAAVGERVESPLVGIVLFESAVVLVAGGYLGFVGGVTLRFEPLSPTDLALGLAAVPVPYALGAVTDRVLAPFGVELEGALALSPRSLPVAVPVALFLVGPAEELLYRGVVLGLLVDPLGTSPAVAVMALLFGAVHVPSYGVESVRDLDVGVAVGCLNTGAVGALYAGLYLATGSLVVAILAHSLYDVALFVRIAFRGDDTGDSGNSVASG